MADLGRSTGGRRRYQYLRRPGQVTAEGRPESAVIVLFKLATCHRRRAYDAIQWYFPEYGEHFDPHRTGYQICTGA
jgi:hypothetical protein